ncbi:hypothetical protein C2E23DRAFT_220147 [Lenzites betulinus]|nr:hypothetical protein C2E23DRAFT_220147 [Lenzites betulinus]
MTSTRSSGQAPCSSLIPSPSDPGHHARTCAWLQRLTGHPRHPERASRPLGEASSRSSQRILFRFFVPGDEAHRRLPSDCGSPQVRSRLMPSDTVKIVRISLLFILSLFNSGRHACAYVWLPASKGQPSRLQGAPTSSRQPPFRAVPPAALGYLAFITLDRPPVHPLSSRFWPTTRVQACCSRGKNDPFATLKAHHVRSVKNIVPPVACNSDAPPAFCACHLSTKLDVVPHADCSPSHVRFEHIS